MCAIRIQKSNSTFDKFSSSLWDPVCTYVGIPAMSRVTCALGSQATRAIIGIPGTTRYRFLLASMWRMGSHTSDLKSCMPACVGVYVAPGIPSHLSDFSFSPVSEFIPNIQSNIK